MHSASPFFRLDAPSMIHPPKAIAEFVKKLTVGVPPGGRSKVERRQSPRFTLSIVVVVQSLDEDFRPQGECYSVVTRNISANGVALEEIRGEATKFLALQLTSATGEKLKTIIEVVREDGVNAFACKFVTVPSNQVITDASV